MVFYGFPLSVTINLARSGRRGPEARTRRPRSRWLSGCPPGAPTCPASWWNKHPWGWCKTYNKNPTKNYKNLQKTMKCHDKNVKHLQKTMNKTSQIPSTYHDGWWNCERKHGIDGFWEPSKVWLHIRWKVELSGTTPPRWNNTHYGKTIKRMCILYIYIYIYICIILTSYV